CDNSSTHSSSSHSLHDALPIYSASGQLLRTPEILANLAVGIEYFLNFAKDAGAIDEKESQSIWKHCWNTLISLGEVQTLRLHEEDRKSTRLNSSHVAISYAVFC